MSKPHTPVVTFYIEGEAIGAIPNGKRIRKHQSEPGDSTPNGTEGTVISSITVPDDMREEFGGKFFYWVEWDDKPGMPVGVLDKKVTQ